MRPLLKRTFLSLKIGLHTRLRGIRIFEFTRMHVFAAPSEQGVRRLVGLREAHPHIAGGVQPALRADLALVKKAASEYMERKSADTRLSIGCPSGHSARGYQDLKRQPHLPRDRPHRLPQNKGSLEDAQLFANSKTAKDDN
jgi:hypothetical protein